MGRSQKSIPPLRGISQFWKPRAKPNFPRRGDVGIRIVGVDQILCGIVRIARGRDPAIDAWIVAEVRGIKNDGLPTCRWLRDRRGNAGVVPERLQAGGVLHQIPASIVDGGETIDHLDNVAATDRAHRVGWLEPVVDRRAAGHRRVGAIYPGRKVDRHLVKRNCCRAPEVQQIQERQVQ